MIIYIVKFKFVTSIMDLIETNKQQKIKCKSLFSAMNDSIKENLERNNGRLLPSHMKPILMRFDLTKCSEYDIFVAENNNIKLKYNLFDTGYLNYAHYDISWNGVTNEMNVALEEKCYK